MNTTRSTDPTDSSQEAQGETLEAIPSPVSGPAVKAATSLIFLCNIDFIILRPDKDEPGITYRLSNGDRVINVFNDDKECDEVWAKLEIGLANQDFVHHCGVFINARKLVTVEKCHTEELGRHIAFKFARATSFIQQYNDDESLDADYTRIVGLLALMQDTRVGHHASPTRH